MSPGSHSNERLVRLPIGLPEELYEWLRHAAFERRVPMAQLFREALVEHRERIDPQLRLSAERDRGEKRS